MKSQAKARMPITRRLMTSTSNFGEALSLGILAVCLGFILSTAMLFAPLHEFVHVVAGWFTGTKLLAISWTGVAHEEFVPAIIMAGFPGELAVWTIVVIRAKTVLVKSFFFGVAIDTMQTGLRSADYNTFLEIAWGYYEASVARAVYAIVSMIVLTVLTVVVITAWLKEKQYAYERRKTGRRESVQRDKEARQTNDHRRDLEKQQGRASG